MSEIYANLEFEQIPVHKSGEVEYEKSVATAYFLYRFARPLYVVRPTHPAQVQDFIRHLIEYNKEKPSKSQISVTIKGGGHSYAGFSSTNKGILLDLSSMNKVKLNLDQQSKPKSVVIRGGALWGHVYKQLIIGGHNGYMIPGGDCPTVGVSGFVLGGGLSFFSRSLGMGCDSLTEATIVTADGRLVTVGKNDGRDTDEGRLFWALRGGGAGNFGIVVNLKMDLHRFEDEINPKDTRTTVIAGRYTWYLESGEETGFMDTMDKFYTTDWSDSIAIHSSWLCDIQDTGSELAVRFIVYHNGTKRSFNEQLHKFIDQGGIFDGNREHRERLADSLRSRSLEEPTTLFLHETLLAQWSEETQVFFPSDKSYKYFSSFVFERDKVKEITPIVKERTEAFRKQFRRQQGLLQVTVIHSGGKSGEPAPSDTAFSWRKERCYTAYIMVLCKEKWLKEDMKKFLVNFTNSLRRKSMDEKAAFINFADVTLQRDEHEEAYYGDNINKLREVKQHWDPGNFFHYSQGIRVCAPANLSDANDFYRPVSDEEIVHQQWENYPAALPPTDGFPGIEGYPY